MDANAHSSIGIAAMRSNFGDPKGKSVGAASRGPEVCAAKSVAPMNAPTMVPPMSPIAIDSLANSPRRKRKLSTVMAMVMNPRSRFRGFPNSSVSAWPTMSLPVT